MRILPENKESFVVAVLGLILGIYFLYKNIYIIENHLLPLKFIHPAQCIVVPLLLVILTAYFFIKESSFVGLLAILLSGIALIVGNKTFSIAVELFKQHWRILGL